MNDEFAGLMRAAQAGDSDAYLELLQRITPRIRQIVGRRRGFAGPADVEDLVQDILLSLHTVRATFDPDRPFMPWLLAIVRNRLADAARRYARTGAHEIAVEEPDVTFGAGPSNTHDEGLGDPELLERAIQLLPRGQREAIDLLKLKELSLKEASAVSGTSVGALKVATHRAMATLRQMLGQNRRT